jgi:hypothetical protein
MLFWVINIYINGYEIMGQKAKNAGKKQSKTCNKKANTKSVCGGGCAKAKVFTPIQILEHQLMSLDRNPKYVKGIGKVLKSNGTALQIS